MSNVRMKWVESFGRLNTGCSKRDRSIDPLKTDSGLSIGSNVGATRYWMRSILEYDWVGGR